MKTSIIDFLSFTWTPAELGQILDLAKMGASIKAIRKFDEPKYRDNVTREMLDTGAIDYRKAVIAKLQDTQFSIGEDARRFHEVKSSLLDHFGYNTMDALCRGEIDRFMNRLMNGLTNYDITWTYELCVGGFSGYPHSANIYADGKQAGKCAWGAKNHGCYISISGTGCAFLDFHAVHDMLHDLPGAKITRVDIAHDCLNGEYDVNTARNMAEEGQFVTRGRPASYCYIESGHMAKLADYTKASGKTETVKKRYGFVPDKGRSFYVGSRDAGKMLRVYEKGKQLQSEQHPDWVRWELELRSKDRVIPFATLIEPSKYLAGAYPALSFVNQYQQCAIATHKRNWFTSIDNAVKNGATQCGKLVNFMKNVMDLDDSKIIHLLTQHLDMTEIPDRLNTPAFQETQASKLITLSTLRRLSDGEPELSLAQ